MKKKRQKTINYETLVSKYVYEKTKNGEKVTNADIIDYVKDSTGIIISDSQIRLIINDLRNNDVILLLLADTKGFFIAKNAKEVKSWILTHEKKIESMKLTLKSIKRQLNTKKALISYLGENF